MDADLAFYALAIPAVIFAGVSKGGFGSGAAFAAAPILALAVDPRVAVAVLLPLLMVIDVAALKPYWRQWDGPAARLLFIGSLPGAALGAVFLGRADADLIRLLIGGIAVAFVVWQLARARGLVSGRAGQGSTTVGLIAGAVAGFTSFVSHAGGPAVAVYLLARDPSKTLYQATTVVVFWAMNLLKFFIYIGIGLFTFDLLAVSLTLVPVALLGTWIGVRLHHMVPERAFFALTYILLTVTGGKLIWDALT